MSILLNNKISHKGYDIEKINGGINVLLNCLIKKKNLTNFNPMHKTRPIIFLNGKFIGGYDELISQ